MNIYIASPLFHKWEQRNVKHVAEWIKTIYPNANVYCPQDFKVPNGWELPNDIWAKKVFEEDHKRLNAADLVVCISYGYKSDDGAAWEVGYAQAKGKEVWLVAPNYDFEPTSLMFMTADKMFTFFGKDDAIVRIGPVAFQWK